MFSGRNLNPGLTCAVSTMTVSLHMRHYELGISWIRAPLQKGPSTLFTNYWLFPKYIKKKSSERTKICWHSRLPTQCDVNVRYSGNHFWKVSSAAALSSLKVHGFTTRVFQRRQQLLVLRYAKCAFTEPFQDIKLSHLVMVFCFLNSQTQSQ